MKYIMSKSTAPDNRMPGDRSDSRIMRLTQGLCPSEPVPVFKEGSNGSLIIDLTGLNTDTRGKLTAALMNNSKWPDVTIFKIAA